MSVARQVKMNYDLQTLEQAARELGYLVTRNNRARGWAGSTMVQNADLVITSTKHQFDMGFVKQEDGSVKMHADYHGGHVQRDMAERIIPRYLELKTRGRLRVTGQQSTAQHVTLHLER